MRHQIIFAIALLLFTFGSGSASADSFVKQLDDFVSIQSILNTSSGDLVAAGSSIHSGFVVPFLCKFNQSGTLQWSRTFAMRGYSSGSLRRVIETTSGGFLAIGEVDSSPLILKVNSRGKPVWSRVFAGDGELNSIIQISTGGELIELLEKLAGIAWISPRLITEIVRQAGKEK